jgi:phytanoyl-CoA hydroxylase
MTLSEEQLAFFKAQGTLLIPDFFDKETANNLINESNRLLDELDISTHPKTVFHGSDSDRTQTGDDYFLESGDKIRYFFEEKAFQDGKLVVDKTKAINKIGHALHALNPTFKAFSFLKKVKEVAASLKLDDPLVLQSMIIFKQPYIGGEVSIHQDNTFLHTDPESAIGFWFALEDCTVENSCLYYLPGSHTQGIHNSRRFVRSQSGKGVEFTNPPKKYNIDEFVPVECKAGSLVLIDGNVVHYSNENKSPRSRTIYTFHMIGNPERGYKYSPDNWLQPSPSMPFTPLFGTEIEDQSE